MVYRPEEVEEVHQVLAVLLLLSVVVEGVGVIPDEEDPGH